MNNNREELIFEEALKRSSEAERVAFLDDLCGGDVELRARLDLLLEGYFKADRFLAREPASHSVSPDEAIGTLIGRYKLLEKIGEGGFGVVYVAEQSEPVKRGVALKIIKLGMDTKQVVARFEAERQALALMDHPNIARVFDGGATETGRPYFVMELVRGVPITKYCEENGLEIDERLKLFALVCQAVQHAHQKGIIHRDLKPSNILLTVNDGVAVPKVIDFGVAKATQQELTEKTIFTQFHHFIGTPAYVSPEQAEITSVDIDTRSDIYSLGVLLYELITGKTPFDGKELLASGLDEMRRTIREKEPLKPSTRVGRERAGDPSRSTNRGEAQIDPDLDCIVLKCLEKDRARRYETASSLASDIQRHLRDEPVTAQPPSASYRLRKIVRRNKVQFAAGIFALVALIAGIAVSSWQAVRANRERAVAEKRLQTAVLLMKQAFESASPALSDLIGTTKARQDLVRAAEGVVEELRRDPNPSAELRRLLAQFYLQLSTIQAWLGYSGNTTGQFEEGLASAREAIRLLAPTGSDPVDDYRLGKLARAEMNASFGASGLLRFDDALEHIGKMEEWGRALQRRTNRWSAAYGRELCEWSRQLRAEALIRMDRSGEALNHLGRSLEEFRKRAHDAEQASQSDLWLLHGELELLGSAHLRLGHKVQAASFWRERLAVAEIENGRWPHLMSFAASLAECRAQLGEVLLALGSTNEALPLLAAGLHQVDHLRRIDPENPGLVLLKVRVLGCHASGYTEWALHGSAPKAECQKRLTQAEDYMQQAVARMNRLKPEALRKFTEYQLAPLQRRMSEAKAQLESARPEAAPPLQSVAQ